MVGDVKKRSDAHEAFVEHVLIELSRTVSVTAIRKLQCEVSDSSPLHKRQVVCTESVYRRSVVYRVPFEETNRTLARSRPHMKRRIFYFFFVIKIEIITWFNKQHNLVFLCFSGKQTTWIRGYLFISTFLFLHFNLQGWQNCVTKILLIVDWDDGPRSIPCWLKV